MIALDTHVLIWWLSDKGQLPTRVRRLIDKESRQTANLYVSSISIWEISILVARGRLALRVNLDDWIAQVEEVPAIEFIPIDNRIALLATQLPEPLHKDPADRMIIATAKEMAIPLVSADQKIRTYQHIETIW